MTEPNDLFSHPDTHRSEPADGHRDDRQRSYTDLFREPVDPSQPTGQPGQAFR
ncbi:hypothetical protein FHS29_002489 [Saccharothrix tamanrassetensis]|uniref:Uncharacterized protein n=1 Tax=Saccharothrix tamanrassetensis TaxID=1051531 RepID=A0A841CI87_9PSEU|nr:hypothetical protein [Saccharothrix tamanrassetensis]MBB5955908.1 hypothetical protein [Saccharothrix tamanrassetensis]